MIDVNLCSFEVLENVYLKTTQNIETGGKVFGAGEVIAKFDKIQIANINEVKSYVSANGGYDNRGHVFWETTRAVKINFSQGVFSKTQFGILNNSKIIKIEEDEPLLITTSVEAESDEIGVIRLDPEPVDQLFIYAKDNGEKIEWQPAGNNIKISERYKDVVAIYRYNYLNGAMVARIGQPFLNGFLELEGTTRVKDDTSGLITTGIIRIPKLKLMSGLSIRLGAQANPVVGNFSAECVPIDSRKSSSVMEIYFLDEDIDSDM